MQKDQQTNSVHPASGDPVSVTEKDAGMSGDASRVTVDSPLFMVFDVESIGLHGEGFAVGYVVCNRSGEVIEEATLACNPNHASGKPENRRWVQENVPAMDYSGYLTPDAVRNSFWLRWLRWKAHGALLVADCCWPVEARFLAACVDDYGSAREWAGPYPLHDLASVLLARGRDPMATNERLPNELPAHHPLHDARQSARLLCAALGASSPMGAAPATESGLTSEDAEGTCASSGQDEPKEVSAAGLQVLVPAGWRLVPIEPTSEMVAAMAYTESSGTINGAHVVGISGAVEAYDAMLSASPAAPEAVPVQQPRKSAMWGITYDGYLQSFIYRSQGEAAAEMARRNAEYPDEAEHRVLVAIYTHPADSAANKGETK